MAFPDIEFLLDLSKLYGVSINELIEDHAILARISVCPFEVWNDIACYVPPMGSDPDWAQREQDMCNEKWIERLDYQLGFYAKLKVLLGNSTTIW